MQTIETRVETEITALENSQSALLKWMGSAAVIMSEDEQRNAEDMLIHARQSLRDVEAKRKELLEPVNETRDRINALFKPLSDRLNMGIFVVNGALQAYHLKQAKEAEELRNVALAEQVAKMTEARETGEVVEVTPTADIPDAPPKTSHAHLGAVTYREDFEVSIVDPLLVPRELCDPNLSRIRARVKSGVMEIPGVLITKKYITIARGSK
jgi:dGTP triphosphohydrolase